MLVMGYATRPYSPDCLDGEIVSSFPDYDFQCLNGHYTTEPKTEKEIAVMAKEAKKDFDTRYAKEEQFCGKGNVSPDKKDAIKANYNYSGIFPIAISCKDYSLVPDENLK